MQATGFSKLDHAQRLAYLKTHCALTDGALWSAHKAIDQILVQLADQCIENAIGCYALPLGFIPCCVVDDHAYVVPLAIEETSVIAGVSKMAKWVQQSGSLKTQVKGRGCIGQVHLPAATNLEKIRILLNQYAPQWMQEANQQVLPNRAKRGGGVIDFELRALPSGAGMVIHVIVDACDAMGANMVNQVCEFLAPKMGTAFGERIGICIVSNAHDREIVHAELRLEGVSQAMQDAVCEAAHFAAVDYYRACTSNKGVMNGIDGVLIATGNDWRAVEASVHCYAARSGRYTTVTQWRSEGGTLVGSFAAPLPLGTVGGTAKIHPTAQLAYQLLGFVNREQLMRVTAAVGLLQNGAALHALCSEGITAGHMALHVQNLMLACRVQSGHRQAFKQVCQAHLAHHGHISQQTVGQLYQTFVQEAQHE